MFCFEVTRLASFAAGCEIFEIKDLKILYNKLGIENKKIVFMFGDQHVAEEGKNIFSSIFDSKLNIEYFSKDFWN